MSTKDTLTAGLNESVAKKNALNLDNYVKAAEDSFASNKEAEKSVINTTHDAAKTNTQAQYDKAVDDTKVAYESEYERNAVQKLINEKQVAEKMANLGLTDSGLNRTQQTAVQLSYANQKGKIDLARQSAIDDLTLNLTSALSDIENSRSSALLESDEKWADRAYEEGRTNYNNDIASYDNQISSYVTGISDIEQAEIDAAAEVQKAQISASAKTENNSIYKINYGELTNTTYSSNGNVKYTDINGNTVEMRAGTNPFTNSINSDVLDKWGEFDKSKVFSNGYQPNNYKGEELHYKGKTEVAWRADGTTQAVWETDDGKCYVWVGPNNCYEEVTYNKKTKEWELVREIEVNG